MYSVRVLIEYWMCGLGERWNAVVYMDGSKALRNREGRCLIPLCTSCKLYGLIYEYVYTLYVIITAFQSSYYTMLIAGLY